MKYDYNYGAPHSTNLDNIKCMKNKRWRFQAFGISSLTLDDITFILEKWR